jgi:hypothetical protein
VDPRDIQNSYAPTTHQGEQVIIELQRRLSEAGRIRIGQQVAGNNGRKRPEKLTTFRLTSADRTRIEQAAQVYGGTVQQWDAPAGKQWEVVTETDSLNVIVPPSDMCFSQAYELWSGGGCARRCDGYNESISQGPCVCDPDKRECNIHTRLSVMLADLNSLGVWRLDTSGWYAALELQGAVGVIQMAAGRGQMLPARLRLEQRMVKRLGEGTRRFAVPVLDVEISPAQLLGGSAPQPQPILVEQGTGRVLDNPERPALTPVPDTVVEHPVASIADQSAPIDDKPKRRSTTPAVPKTGIAPRTVAQAAADAVEEPAAVVSEPEQEPVELITPAQLKKLSIQLREAGFDTRETAHAFVIAAIERQITSSKELTKDEASKVIDLLENDKQ